MRKKDTMRTSLILALFVLLSGQLMAFEPMYGYCPETPHDPVIWDGQATTWEEWAWAARFPDWFNDGTYPNAGFFYHEHKHGWQATSSSANTAVYLGLVYFFAHDIEGEPAPSPFVMFRQRDDNDWNVAEFTYEGLNVKCWIFGGDDADVDTGWVKLSDGLAESHLVPEVGGDNLIDDAEGSFIVRFNDDPATDTHWFRGYPEPGDPDWDWADWYGAFGSYGFNNSFYTTGLDTRTGYDGDNEVYEWAFYWGHPGDSANPVPDTVILPGGIPAPPPIDSTQIRVVIIDPPKDTLVYIAPNWWIHFWFPHPWPDFEVDLFPGPDIEADLGEDVEVNFYLRNMGLSMMDTYNGTVSDTKGWPISSETFQTTIMSEDWEIRSATLTVPPEGYLAAPDIVDTVIVTVTSEGDPSLVKACSLAVNVNIPGIEEQGALPPESFRFSATQPDKNNMTTLSYELPQESQVKLVIYDAAGREVSKLLDDSRPSGSHTLTWVARSDDGEELPAGIYIARFEADEFSATEKIVLVR